MTTIHVQVKTSSCTAHTATVQVGEVEHAIGLPLEPMGDDEPSVDIADNGDVIVTYLVSDDSASYDDMIGEPDMWGKWERLRGSLPCIGMCECGKHDRDGVTETPCR